MRNQINAGDEIVDAVRNGDPLPDSKLNALVTYVRKAVEARGFVEESDIQAFLDAGYSKRQVLEANLIIVLKTISNYTNHLAETPLDEAFEPEKVEFTPA